MGQKIVGSWGAQPTPLLPQQLRQLLSDTLLPQWVVTDLHLQSGAGASDLDATVWQPRTDLSTPLQRISPRVQQFLVTFVRERIHRIQSLRVFPGGWPQRLDPRLIPWSQRTENVLTAAHLMDDRSALGEVTFGELLSLRTFGILSLLDFSCVAEAVISQFQTSPVTVQSSSPELNTTEAQKKIQAVLVEAIDAPWADQISEQDPRFADLLPSGRGTVLERLEELISDPMEDPYKQALLAKSIEGVSNRTKEISKLLLEDALHEFLKQLSGYSDVRLKAVSARLGFAGTVAPTLQATADVLGVTRERVRQIQKKVLERMPNHVVFMPQLDRAILLLAGQVPVSFSDAQAAFISQKICRSDFSPLNIAQVASALGRSVNVQLDKKHEFVVGGLEGSRSFNATLRNVLHVSRSQASASGATNIEEVLAELASKNVHTDEGIVRAILTDMPKFEFLSADWFWHREGSVVRNRLRNQTRQMLSVAAPISVKTLREGLRRHFKYRGTRGLSKWPLRVPPRSILQGLYQAHPEFRVTDEGEVHSVEPLNYHVELSPGQQTLVDVIRSSPTCIMDRMSCVRGCLERGMNEFTLSAYMTYASFVEHVDTDVWSLRGLRLDPAAVEAVRHANALRSKEKRVLDSGWADDGNPWVGARVRMPVGTFVFNVPLGVRPFLANTEFTAIDETGVPSGRVQIDADGLSWGYGSFLRRVGGDEGDILFAEFSLSNKTVTLSLGDDDLLERLSPTSM